MIDQIVDKYKVFVDKVSMRHCPICDFNLQEKDGGLCCEDHGNLFDKTFIDIEGKKYNERLLAVVKAVLDNKDDELDPDKIKNMNVGKIIEGLQKVKDDSEKKKNIEHYEYMRKNFEARIKIAHDMITKDKYPALVVDNIRGKIKEYEDIVKACGIKIEQLQGA